MGKTLNERWQDRMVSLAPKNTMAFEAVLDCTTELKDACTPRPPQAEWFGDPDTEPGKWDAWWFEDFGVFRQVHIRPGTTTPEPWLYGNIDGYAEVRWRDSFKVVPVAREGFPAPVGWGVVGVL